MLVNLLIIVYYTVSLPESSNIKVVFALKSMHAHVTMMETILKPTLTEILLN